MAGPAWLGRRDRSRRARGRGRRSRPSPNFSARNRPWATSASASTRKTASKILSMVASSRSSWSHSSISDVFPFRHGAAARELPGQPQVAADRLRQVVGRGRHDGVRLRAARAQVAQPRAWSRGPSGRPGAPGTRPRPAPRPATCLHRCAARGCPPSVGTAGTATAGSCVGRPRARRAAPETHARRRPRASARPRVGGRRGRATRRHARWSCRSHPVEVAPATWSTSVSSVPMVAAIESSAFTLKVSIESIVA